VFSRHLRADRALDGVIAFARPARIALHDARTFAARIGAVHVAARRVTMARCANPD
jgi:hypothetical protein